MLRIGYACLTVGKPLLTYRTITQKFLSKERLYAVIAANLATLKRHLAYNLDQGIYVFRISSDLIPFGSSPFNQFPWAEDFANEFYEISAYIKKHNLRVSMHPGQYTVLNSPSERVVEASILDLTYHQKVLSLLGANSESKIILHIGGIYGDKEAAIERFVTQYHLLSSEIKAHLVIENDDHFYDLETVLGISYVTGAPVIFDLFHHQVLPSLRDVNTKTLLELVRATWRKTDGRLKIHYSEPDLTKRSGAHSQTIGAASFLNTFNPFLDEDIDVMLEVKDKNLSAIKCTHLIAQKGDIKELEVAWSHYKYLVLERDHLAYQTIRSLLNNKDSYPALEFYSLIETALKKEATLGSITNAATHVWGYFKDKATEAEKRMFEKRLLSLKDDIKYNNSLKRFLRKLAFKYEETYLINSLYLFMDGLFEIK